MDDCVFCSKSLGNGEQTTKLGAKGCDGISKANDLRQADISVAPGQVVHTNCRKDFCSQLSIERDNRKRDCTGGSSVTVRARRSASSAFHYSEHCLFCGTPDKYQGRQKTHKLIPVRTMDFQKKVTERCVERNDAWSETVKARVDFVQDLHAADAVYHNICSINFRTGKQIPHQFLTVPSKRPKYGRPADDTRNDAFIKVAEYLKANDEEQTTIPDLIEKMGEFLAGTDCTPYGFTYMKECIQKHFGQDIIIAEINGKENVVTFRHRASAIIHEFHQMPKETSSEAEKMRLIKTAAKLITSDVKSVEQSIDMYPGSTEMSSTEEAMSFLPESLKLLLQTLFVGRDADRKVGSLGQAIMQAIRPRVLLPPLQIGLGVQMHHHFASKFLIDMLHAHGYCSSYREIQRYERSAAVALGTDIPNYRPEQVIQYMADNVDHNIRTIDGLNTFHGMGMIASVTPGTRTSTRVPRVSVTLKDVLAVGRINIRHLTSPCDGLHTLRYEVLQDEMEKDRSTNLDLLWKLSLILRSPRPAWSGMMQAVHTGVHPGQSAVFLLPMIDMNSSDPTCIYSTLTFLSEHAKQYNAKVIITFDQPLWWKALTIIESQSEGSDLRKIVLRLGGFHTLMSFLGSIGNIMSGSGLRSVLELVYAENTVTHMLSGKAYDRAIRGHLLVDAALNTLLSERILGTLVPTGSQAKDDGPQGTVGDDEPSEDEIMQSLDDAQVATDPHDTESGAQSVGAGPVDLCELRDLYDSLMKGEASTEDIISAPVLDSVRDIMNVARQSMKDLRTAQLWLQYMDMINILRTFLRSERTGDWRLHMHALHDMLPYLAAAGHNLYTKSIYVYLQRLAQLSIQHPEVHHQFQNGYHVVRRSDRYWAGLSTDLLIEQVLMRSVKTTGGLTRGRGMSESQRITWLLSTPLCAEVNLALQDYTSVQYGTSDQHKEQRAARQARDTDDTHKLIGYLSSKDPFGNDPTLQSIDTGITAGDSVNADQAASVGRKILDGMVDKKVLDHTFKKNNQVVTFDTRSSVKTGKESVLIDPQLLFQRLSTAGSRCDDLTDVFKYELCSYPPALFQTIDILLEADKPALAEAIWKQLPLAVRNTVLPQNVQYVLDGGALLHRIPWNSGETYEGICSHYVRYVGDRYGNAVIVFDGYVRAPSTKDVAHSRRVRSHSSPLVNFTKDMVCTMKKDDFLGNQTNKQRFINLLSDNLQRQHNDVLHAKADADVLIVETTIACANTKDTVLVGDDTDLLVLLCSRAGPTSHNLFFRPEPKLTSRRQAKCWNIEQVQKTVGRNVCDKLLVAHGLLGCDTTSRLYSIGKSAALKKLNSSAYFSGLLATFNTPGASKEDVMTAGENALVCLYNGQPGETLDILRHQRFCKKVSTSTVRVEPRTLPPTSASAKQHCLRVYVQVQQWQGVGMEANGWGWAIRDERMVPVMTEMKPAPDYLLDAIHCGCKADCSTQRCSCRKYNLECSSACSECKGLHCSNVTLPEPESDPEEEYALVGDEDE